MPRRQPHSNHLYQALGTIALSVFIALLILESSAFEVFLAGIGEKRLIGSFLAGALFTSVFTTAPAIVILGELAQANSAWRVAVMGALGALTMDYVIFRFIRNQLADDAITLLQQRRRRFKKLWRLPSARWVAAGLGMLIIASPLPDELGVALLGIVKTKPRIFFMLSFIANFLGILAIGTVAKRLVE